MREDLIKEIAELAKLRKFDYLVIESTGIAEPLPIAQAFFFENSKLKALQSLARLDTMVTMVDAAEFHKHLGSIEKVQEINVITQNQQEIPLA